MPNRILALTALACALVGACASMQVPETPPELRPAQDEALLFQTMASGVQIYECTADAAAPSGFQWRFKGPEAELTDRTGRTMGRHYGGPTWEGPDGSKVVAEMRAQSPSPDAGAIPLLLLRAKATSGSGMFTPVSSIQRLDTVGGRAPSGGCSAETVTKVARMPYKATYFFYGRKAGA
jgi:hypothetical protein